MMDYPKWMDKMPWRGDGVKTCLTQRRLGVDLRR